MLKRGMFLKKIKTFLDTPHPSIVLSPDNAFINPQLQKIFERVRQSADFMPAWQMNVSVRENPSVNQCLLLKR